MLETDKWFTACHTRLSSKPINLKQEPRWLHIFWKTQLPKILLGAILPNVRPPHPNPLAQQFLNNGEQWGMQDNYGRIEIEDCFADMMKASEDPDSRPYWED